MPKFRKIAAGVAALTAAAVALPAHAQTGEVPVSLLNTSGTRKIVIEDMAGSPLTSLNFGETRSLPFRVRVEDKAVGAAPFTVNASLTNLYFDNGSGPAYNTLIESENVQLAPQVGLGFDVLDVKATLQPVVDLTTKLTGVLAPLCLAITGATPITGGCEVTRDNVAGNVLDRTIPVDLSALGNLPLLPTSPDTGVFEKAEYAAGLGKDDTVNGDNLPGSQLKLAGGTPVTGSAVFDPLKTQLNTLTRSELISDQAVLASLGDVVTKLTSPLINTLGATTDDLLAATTSSVDTLGAGQLLSLTGQYISLPKLTVSVPSKNPALPSGTYKGTLVVTGLQ